MNEVTVTDRSEIMEQVLLKGDLAKLTAAERNTYYMQTCHSLGLNPLTQPFAYITLNGKLTMYAKRDAADRSLRKINGVNIEILSQRMDAGLFIVTVRATDKTGRQDEDMGVVSMPAQGAGEALTPCWKAITKATGASPCQSAGLGSSMKPRSRIFRPAPSARRPAVLQKSSRVRRRPYPLRESRLWSIRASSPSDLPSDDAGMSQDELADIDDRLAEAATRGWKALKEAWEFLADDVQDELRDNLNRIHKPNAKAVGP